MQMELGDWIWVAAFAVVFVLMNWKGNAFLRLPLGRKLLIAGAIFVPMASWIVYRNLGG